MRCVICKHGETRLGTATLTLYRDGTTLIMKGAPATICVNCGEEYVDGSTTARLLRTADEAARAGVELAVHEYEAT